MSKKKCLGLLGFAGNYGAVNPNDLTQPLKFAMDNYDVIDLSHDYGIKYNLLSIVVRLMPARSKARYIYKIGREYKGNYNACELIASSTKGIESLGPERLECIMFHRPAEEKLKSDIEAFEYLSKQYPFLSWGICTNDEEVYLNYKKQTRVDCVQLALNPFDYSSVQPFIRTLIADKVAIQARSILSSGFLSGKYNTNSTFDDPLRLRYNTPEYRTHYLERIHIGNDILKYIGDNDIIISLQPNSPEVKFSDLKKALSFFKNKLYKNSDIKELICINKKNTQNPSFRILTYKAVFQKTLSTKIGVYFADYEDIHTKKEYLKVKKKIEK